MTDPVSVQIMGGLLIAIISGTVGKSLGGYNKVSNAHCNERRQGCNALVLTKLANIEAKLDSHMKHHEE